MKKFKSKSYHEFLNENHEQHISSVGAFSSWGFRDTNAVVTSTNDRLALSCFFSNSRFLFYFWILE